MLESVNKVMANGLLKFVMELFETQYLLVTYVKMIRQVLQPSTAEKKQSTALAGVVILWTFSRYADKCLFSNSMT